MIYYSDRVVRATHQVLLEVFQLLEIFHESLVLIGGWVPIMIIPDAVEKHLGTIDVDLAINDRTLIEIGSETCSGTRPRGCVYSNGCRRI